MVQKQKKRRILLMAGLGLLIVAIVLPLLLRGGGDAALARGTVHSATVERGSIATTVTGTGSLETGGGEVIRIPAGLTLDEVFVQTGDMIHPGDELAVFDLNSIRTRIAAVQEEIADLDEEIEDTRRDTEATTIRAGVTGEIETLFAQEGDLVSDLMLTHGALLLLAVEGSEREPLAVIGTSGRVSRVHVSEGARVRAGATLFTLTDVDSSPTYQALLAERAEQVETLQSLLALLRTEGVLHAPFDGIVEAVSIGDRAPAPATPGGFPGGLPAGGLPPGMMGLANNQQGGGNVGLMRLSATEAEPAENPEPPETPQPPQPPALTEITTLADLVLAPPVLGATPQRTIEASQYTGTVEWNPAAQVFLPGTTYQAALTLTARPGYIFGLTVLMELAQEGLPVPNATIIGVDPTGPALGITLLFPATEMPEIPGGPGGMPEMPGFPNFSMPAFPSFQMPGMDAGAMGTPPRTDSRVPAFTVATGDVMYLAITIDERDILDIQVGQRAEVRLDALPDEVFFGEISRVSATGTAGGGGARYAVEVRLPRAEQMRPGMSASAVITTEEITDILILPLEAIQEEGMEIYVYTALDGQTPINPVPVQTGLSDGVYVEILHGLTAGDTAFYIVLDSFRWGQWGMAPWMS
ncbi:MAG: HlyD family secretion protein [Oscillospiraceae bacterium]|nr:HlyD family secretion protein [Oscillospiraceae bacterium]